MTIDADLEGMHVLIVEDHQGMAELLAEEINEAGLTARWVSHAEKAVALLSRWHADIIVSDMRLPGADGLALLNQVKAMEHAPAFLIITAFGTVDQAVAAIKAGADDFMTKPLDLRQFMFRLERLLEIRKLQFAGVNILEDVV